MGDVQRRERLTSKIRILELCILQTQNERNYVNQKMQPGEMFAKGELPDNEQGINMMNTGQILRWVACRGQIADWAIYCSRVDRDWEEIRHMGDKVHDRNNIKNCVNVDDQVMSVYRD